jgi:hypothetical protein
VKKAFAPIQTTTSVNNDPSTSYEPSTSYYSGHIPHHGMFKCNNCDETFINKTNLSVHIRQSCRVSSAHVNMCKACSKHFKNNHTLTLHRQYECKKIKNKQLNNPGLSIKRGCINAVLSDDVFKFDSAFNEYLTNY